MRVAFLMVLAGVAALALGGLAISQSPDDGPYTVVARRLPDVAETIDGDGYLDCFMRPMVNAVARRGDGRLACAEALRTELRAKRISALVSGAGTMADCSDA